MSFSVLKKKETKTGYGIFISSEVILTSSLLFELPINIQLGPVYYNNDESECELLNVPVENLPSTPEIRRLRYLRTKHAYPYVAKVGLVFPGEEDVSSRLIHILTTDYFWSEKYTSKRPRKRSCEDDKT